MVKNRPEMNKMTRIAVSVAVCCLAAACGRKYEEPSDGSMTGFALSFFRKVNDNMNKNDNVVVSPYSAGTAIAMLAEGARGETAAELLAALNGCGFRGKSPAVTDSAAVKSANSLWMDDGFRIRDSYINALKDFYGASVYVRDFSSHAAASDINRWCSDNTDGKIGKIIDRISPDMAMVLVNALYFDAPWQKAFGSEMTRERIFHGFSGDVPVQMMSKRADYFYAEYEGCQMIRLPYASGRYSMYVLLPPAGTDVNDLLPYIGESAYDAAMQMLEEREVMLSFPKYRLETSAVLNGTLESMGVKKAFSTAADFGVISPSRSLALDMVTQKCYIDVSEKGTEAAAVTAVQVRLTSVRPGVRAAVEMTVDRPFLFFIVDEDSAGILFAGKIVNL